MYYSDRKALGRQLADTLPTTIPCGSVIVCLKPSAMPVCRILAKRLQSWVYDLTYEPVLYPGDPAQALGAVTADGGFCVHPSMSMSEYHYVAQEFQGTLADAKRVAMHRLHQRPAAVDAQVDRWLLHSKPVLLVADILTDTLALAAAKTLFQPLKLQGTFAAVGNSTADVYDYLRLQTDACNVLNVLPGHVFNDDHYFEKTRVQVLRHSKHIILPLGIAPI